MDVQELILTALEALKSNVVRTLLTMLGIIIGIASVITIISLGEGSTASIIDQVSSFGANTITIQPGRARRGPGQSSSTVTTLTISDTKVIKKLDNVTDVSGMINTNKKITANGEETFNSIRGVEESYKTIQSLEIVSGVFLDKSHVDGVSRVVVLGDEIVEDLFGEYADVVGETVIIDLKSFRIIGVVNDGSDAYIPLSTAQKILLGQDHLDSISVAVISSNLVESTIRGIEDSLLLEHDIDDLELADFSVRSSQAMIETISSITGTLTAMLSGIAAISLIVGGIGIMNIMLVTVTERTKEIGLLKAIGAEDKDILNQFLIEAVVLTVVGGLIGTLLGLGITYVASTFLQIPFIVGIKSILLAIGVSGGVGVIFGWYPAQKAAKLNPIDALRYE